MDPRGLQERVGEDQARVRQGKERVFFGFFSPGRRGRRKLLGKETHLSLSLFSALPSTNRPPGPRHRRHHPRRPLRQGKARRPPRRVPAGFTVRETAAAARGRAAGRRGGQGPARRRGAARQVHQLLPRGLGPERGRAVGTRERERERERENEVVGRGVGGAEEIQSSPFSL